MTISINPAISANTTVRLKSAPEEAQPAEQKSAPTRLQSAKAKSRSNASTGEKRKKIGEDMKKHDHFSEAVQGDDHNLKLTIADEVNPQDALRTVEGHESFDTSKHEAKLSEDEKTIAVTAKKTEETTEPEAKGLSKWTKAALGAGVLGGVLSLYNTFAKASSSALQNTQDQVQNAFGGVGQALQGIAQQVAQGQQVAQLQADTNNTNNDTLNTLLAALTGQPVPQPTVTAPTGQQQPTPQTPPQPAGGTPAPAHSAPTAMASARTGTLHAAPDAGQGQPQQPAAGQPPAQGGAQPSEGGQQSEQLTNAQKQNEAAHAANEAAKQAVSQGHLGQSQVANIGGQPQQQGPGGQPLANAGQPLPTQAANDGNIQPNEAQVKWQVNGQKRVAIPGQHGGNMAYAPHKKINNTGDRVIIDDEKEAA